MASTNIARYYGVFFHARFPNFSFLLIDSAAFFGLDHQLLINATL
jgi:hypothetical protein